MARIRCVKPEIFQSPQVMDLSPLGQICFLGLIFQADDAGRGSADPRKIKGTTFCGNDEVNGERVAELLSEVASRGLCVLYDAPDHGRLYALPTWSKHQRINRPSASRYPAPPDTSASAHGQRTEDSLNPHCGSDLIGSDGKDRKGGDRKGNQTGAPPATGPKAGRGEIEKNRRRAIMAAIGRSVAEIREQEP
jgi:hypothetical protein